MSIGRWYLQRVLQTGSFRSEANQENACVKCVAGPGMGYGAHITPFLLHAEATAMRATCVQMCHAIQRRCGWPIPVAVIQLDLHENDIGDAGAAALASLLLDRPVAVIQLELQRNAIGNAGAAALAALLKVRWVVSGVIVLVVMGSTMCFSST